MSASAYDFVKNGIYYNIIGNGRAEVTYKSFSNPGYSGNVTIPLSVNYDSRKYNVMRIGDYAFRNCNVNVTYDYGLNISSIGQYAFFNVTFTGDFALPAGLQKVEKGAFAYSNIKGTLSVSEGGLEEIGDSAFARCQQLSELKFTDRLKRIGDYAFCGCNYIKQINLGGAIEYIGDDAFLSAGSPSSVSLGNSIKHIGKEAFRDVSLTSVTIPASVEYIGSCAFGYPYLYYVNYASNLPFERGVSLKTVTINSAKFMDSNPRIVEIFGCDVKNYVLGEGVTKIPDNAFSPVNLEGGMSAESKLESIVLPSSLISIGEQAFNSCLYLQNFDFASDQINLKRIERLAFFNTGLMNITIPEGIEEVGSGAFQKASIPKVIFDKSNLVLPTNCFTGNSTTDVFITSKDKYAYYHKMFKNVYVVGDASSPEEDVNHDGQVNSLDVLKVYKYMQTH